MFYLIPWVGVMWVELAGAVKALLCTLNQPREFVNQQYGMWLFAGHVLTFFTDA